MDIIKKLWNDVADGVMFVHALTEPWMNPHHIHPANAGFQEESLHRHIQRRAPYSRHSHREPFWFEI